MQKVLNIILIFLISNSISEECKKYTSDDPCDSDLFKFIYGESEEFLYDFKSGSVKKLNYSYNRDYTTEVIFPGFDQTYESKDIQDLISAFQKAYGKINIFTMDYPKLVSSKCPEISESNLDYIGKCTSKFIKAFKATYIYAVGFGIGARAVTTFGQNLPKKLRRAIALDPAGDSQVANRSLVTSREYTYFKECFHCSGNVYAVDCGDVDVYFNLDQEAQPGCPKPPKSTPYYSYNYQFNAGYKYGSCQYSKYYANFHVNVQFGKQDNSKSKELQDSENCSHERCLKYYIESITNPNIYGYKCNYVKPNGCTSCSNAAQTELLGEFITVMNENEHWKPRIEGKYKAYTNKEAPFGMGKPGM